MVVMGGPCACCRAWSSCVGVRCPPCRVLSSRVVSCRVPRCVREASSAPSRAVSSGLGGVGQGVAGQGVAGRVVGGGGGMLVMRKLDRLRCERQGVERVAMGGLLSWLPLPPCITRLGISSIR